MKKIAKRVLTTVIAFLMVIQMMPLSAFAADGTSNEVGGATYYTVEFYGADGTTVWDSREVEAGQNIGGLPIAEVKEGSSGKKYYEFDYWTVGTVKITADTVVNSDLKVVPVYKEVYPKKTYDVTIRHYNLSTNTFFLTKVEEPIRSKDGRILNQHELLDLDKYVLSDWNGTKLAVVKFTLDAGNTPQDGDKGNIITELGAGPNTTLTIVYEKAGTLSVKGVPYTGIYDGKSHGGVPAVVTEDGGAPKRNTDVQYSTDGGATWSTTPPTRTEVGTTNVIVKASQTYWHADAYDYYTLTVTPAPVKVTADDKSKVFGTQDPAFTAQVTGLVNGESKELIKYEISRADGESVGTYAITPYGNEVQGNYAVEYISGTLTITKLEMAVSGTPYEGTYDGQTHGTAATASVTEGTTIEYSIDSGETWSTDYPTIKDVGTKTVVVRATNDNYETAYDSYTLKVNSRPVTVTADDKSKVYGAEDPTFTAKVEGLITGEESKIQYTITRSNGDVEDVGSYSKVIVPSGDTTQGNYTVTYVPGDFTITKAGTLTVSGDDYSGTYDGESHGTAATANVTEGTKISYSVDGGTNWTETFPTIKDIGKIEVTVKAENKNYNTATDTYTLEVTPATVTVTVNDASKTYGEADPAFTAEVNGTLGDDKVTYSISRTNLAENAGTYSNVLVASGQEKQGNYIVEYVPGDFTINKAAEFVINVTGHNNTVTYTGEEQYVSGYDVSEYDETIILTGPAQENAVASGTNAGKYDMRLQVADFTATSDNYEKITVEVTDGWLRIEPASGVLTVEGTPYEGVYDGESHGDAATASITEGTTISYSTDNGATWSEDVPTITNVGEITVQVKATNDNYEEATNTYTLEVTPRPVTVAAVDNGKIYGAEDPELTAKVEGLLGTDTVDYTVGREEGENVGEYVITPSGEAEQGNYTVTYVPGTFTIDPKAVTVTAVDNGKIYGAEDPELTAKVEGLLGTDTVDYTVGREEGENVGEYVITPSGEAEQGNYTVTYEIGTFTINPKAVTVTAVDNGKIYGAEDPELTATVEGLVGEDTVEYTVGREEGEDVGEYTITPSGEAEQGNYTVSYVPGTFTIDPKAVTVTAVDNGKIYGADDPELTAKVEGLLGTDTVDYTVGREEGENVGEYVITPSGEAEQGNYTVTYEIGTFTIDPKAVTVTAVDNGKIYGADDPELTAKVEGLLGTDTVEYTVGREEGEDVGEYTITPSGEAVQGNYTVKYETGTFTIDPKAVIVKADDKEKGYGEKDPEFTATVEGLMGEDTVAYSFSREPGESVGSYIITPAGAETQGNYTVTYQTGTLTIIKARMQVSGTSYEGVYDEESHGTAAVATVPDGTAATITYSTDNGATWKSEFPTITDVGELIVQVKAENPNYEAATNSYTLKVTPAPVTVTVDDASKTFGQADPAFTAKVVGTLGTDTVTYTISRTNADEAAGAYTGVLVADGAAVQGNYTVEYVPANFTITKAAGLTVEGTSYDKVYDGESHGDAATASITEGTKISYSIDNGATWSEEVPTITNVEEITVQVKAENANYEEATNSYTLKVTPAPVIVTADDNGKTYGETEPELTAKVEGLLGTDTVSYTVTRAEGEDVGAYEITASGDELQGNYAVSYVQGTFSIDPKAVIVKADDKEKVYGELDPEFTATVEGLLGEDTVDYYFSRELGEEIGSYIITPAGNEVQGNYTVAYQTGTLTITKARMLVNGTSYEGAYDGESHGTAAVATVPDGTAATITYSTDNGATWKSEFPTITDVGELTVQVKAENPNYDDAISSYTLKVTAVPVTVTVQDAEKTYGEADPEFTAIVEGTLGDDTVAYTISRTNADETAGTYTGVLVADGAAAQGNYTVTYVSANFTITKASGLTVEGTSYDKVYDGNTYGDAAIASITEGTKISYSTDGQNWSEEVPTITNVGEVTVQVKAENANYETATNSYTLKVTPAPVTVTVQDSSKTYGEADPAFTAVVDGTLGTDKVTYSISRTNADVNNAGTYESVLVANGAATQGNYTVTYVPANFTINKASSLVVKGEDDGGEYNGEPYGKEATSEGGEDTVIYYSTDGGETWTKEVPTRADAGETKVIVKAEDPNFETVTDEYVIVVTRKAVKVSAENKVKVYGDPNPVFTAVATGLIGDDTLTYNVALEDESACVNVGTYEKAIIASGEEVQGNYTVEYVPADFIITPAVLAVSGTSLSKEYDGTPLVSGYPSVSVVEGTVITYSTDGGKTWTDELPSITDAGELKIIVKAENINYETATGEYTLTVTPKKIQVIVEDQTKKYGDDDPEIKTKVEGLVGDDEIEYTVEREDGENTGSYEIIPKGDEKQGNYEVEYISGELTLEKREVILTSGSASKVYDETPVINHEVTISGDGFAEGEGIGITYEFADKLIEVGTGKNEFTYVLPEGTDLTNYDIKLVFGDLEVTAVPTYRVIIHYVDEDGNPVIEDYTGEYHEGDIFVIDTPAVDGYTPEFGQIVSPEGGMPARDVEITVIMRSNPVIPDPGPDPTPDPTPVPDQGLGIIVPVTPVPGVIVDDGDGGYTVMEIDPAEVPLAPGAENERCCIMHFLLILLAFILLWIYTSRRKQHQKRIFELTEELEETKRALGITGDEKASEEGEAFQASENKMGGAE